MMGGKLRLLAAVGLAAAAGVTLPDLGKPAQANKKAQADVDALDKAEAKRRRKAERNRK